MNILVVGGTRFVGKHLVTKLLADGHNVTIATRGITKDSYGGSVKRICFERTKEEDIKRALSDASFDIVYDNLAYCSNDVKHLLDTVECQRYIEISSTSVYNKLHYGTKEEEFIANNEALVYCEREDFKYSEVKRQAECAIVQAYPHVSSVRVRLPFVIGEDDYTNRLYFYVEHIMKQIPVYIDNLSNQMAFINSQEAGNFLAFLANRDFCGAINGSNTGTISIEQISDYIKQKTGKGIIIRNNGEDAPYNSVSEYSINTDKAKDIGFTFTSLETWIFQLLDKYIARC